MSVPDGSLRIKTKLDNSEIDKDVRELENKIKKLQTDNAKSSKEQDNLQREIEKYNELVEKADEYKKKIEEINSDKKKYENSLEMLSSTTQSDNKKYETKNGIVNITDTTTGLNATQTKQVITEIEAELERVKQEYSDINTEVDKQAPKVEKIETKLEALKQKQTENNEKITEYNRKLEESQTKQISLNGSTEVISKSISSGITKILKYGMALLSIRSVYGLLSNAMNSWLSGNSTAAKQLKADIDYMKNAIGGALSPILKYIVNLLYQALGLTGALIKAFTGIDIFAGSVADYMAATTSSANATNKELKKQLTNFDRINKLEDQSTSSSDTGGTIAPSQDLSEIANKYTEKAEEIKKIFESVKDLAIDIGAIILAWKISDTLSKLFGGGLKETVGLTLMISGIYFLAKGIKGFQDGEITSQDALEAIGGAIGLGVGVGMLTGNVALGVTLTLAGLFIGYVGYGQSKTPWALKELLGLTDVTSLNDGKKYEGQVELSMVIYVFEAALDLASNIIPNIKKLLIEKLLDILYYVADWVKKIPYIGEGIGEGIQAGITSMKKVMEETVEETITEATDGANTTISNKGEEIGINYASSATKAIQSQQETFKQRIEETAWYATNGAKNSVDADGSTLGASYASNIQTGISSSENKISTAITQTTKNATSSNLSSASQNGQKVGTQTVEGMETGTKLKQSLLTGTLTSIIKSANSGADTSSSKTIGSSIISGILSGINGNKSSLSIAMSSVGTMLLSSIKNVLGIHSPSKEMASLAKFIPLGIAEGIDSTSDKAISSMKSLVTDIEDTAANMDIEYDVPKIPKNAVSYVPKQTISTNEIQRTIIGQDDNLLNKVLSNIQANSKVNKTITIPLIIDGEEFIKKTIELNEQYNFATNGGGL